MRRTMIRTTTRALIRISSSTHQGSAMYLIPHSETRSWVKLMHLKQWESKAWPQSLTCLKRIHSFKNLARSWKTMCRAKSTWTELRTKTITTNLWPRKMSQTASTSLRFRSKISRVTSRKLQPMPTSTKATGTQRNRSAWARWFINRAAPTRPIPSRWPRVRCPATQAETGPVEPPKSSTSSRPWYLRCSSILSTK